MKSKKAKLKRNIMISAAAVFCAAVILAVSVFPNTGGSNIVFHGSTANVVRQSDERKNTLIIGVSSAIPDVHPYFHNNDAFYFFQRLVYEPLLSIGNNGSVNYLNAEKIVFENSGRQATVSLDKKKAFSNGEGVTADIVLSSYHSFMKQDTAYNDLLDNIEYINKIDDYTLQFTFKLVRIFNINVFNIPVIYGTESDNAAWLGTGKYAVKSITPYGDSILIRNESASEKGKYAEIILRHMDYSHIDSLNEKQDFDIFMINQKNQADMVKESKAYDIYETGQEKGWYLNYNLDNQDARNAVAKLADGEDFFEETQDYGTYSKGITSAFMKKSNYHSYLKKGNLEEMKSISFLHNYEAEANAIYRELAKRLEENAVICSEAVSDFSEYPQVINSDVLIYYGRFTDMVNHADNERFFEAYQNMNASDFNKNIEKYFALKNKITPLSKDTLWYASLAGKNTVDLFN